MSTMSDNTESGERIRQAAERVAGRIRWNRALQRLATGAFCSTLVVALVMTLWKLGWLEASTFWVATAISAAATVAWVVAARWSEVDLVAAAHRLDRHHALQDRLSTALSLIMSHERDVDRGFVAAQLNDAASAAEQADPQQAAPLRWPKDAAVAGVGAGVVALVAVVQPPEHAHPLPGPPDIRHSVVLDDTSVALARDRLETLREDPDIEADSQASEVLDELADLLDRADNRDISADAFTERLDELESKLERATGEEGLARAADDLQTLAEQLREQAGSELGEFPELDKAAEALDNQDFDKAAEQLDKLAESLSKSPEDGGLSEQKRRKLSKLLERMGGSMSDEELRELYDNNKSLADKFDAPNSDRRLGGGDRRQGDDSRGGQQPGAREENRLDDDNSGDGSRAGDGSGDTADPQRQLKRLRRRAERAAQQRSQSGRSNRQASGRQQRGGQQGADGRRRQANSDGQQQRSGDGQQGNRRRESGRRGASGDGETDRQQARGEQRDRADGSQRQRRRGESRQRRDSQRRSSGGGSDRERVQREIDRMRESMRRSRSGDDGRRRRAGNDQSSSRSDRVRKFIRRAEGRQQKGRSGQSSGQQGRQSGDQASNGAGSGGGQGSSRGQQDRLDDSGDSLEDVERSPTKAESRRGAGPTRREVIRSTSDKGFATTEYRDIYAEYEDVAEEIMEREDVPRGYRFYIQRYFELIRPRSASPPDTTSDE